MRTLRRGLGAIPLLTMLSMFMMAVWNEHLGLGRALQRVAAVSWGIAFFEYCFQPPAKLIGCGS